MSNTMAIAAVTATLRRLIKETLGDDLSGADVTTIPPDKVQDNNDGRRVNLFLYQTELSGHWRNMSMPQQTKPGETGQPPLALDLYYLVTAYGDGDPGVTDHRLLGRAMRTLHDFPVLAPEEIDKATGGDLTGSDLHEQIERVRITPQPMSLDDMSKLWNTFQTQYRISAAYKASVVLIESQRPATTPLPVLKRGPDDEGWDSQPDLIPPFPTITAVEPAAGQPGAQLGTTLTIRGHNLAGDEVSLRFTHADLDDPFVITDAIARNTATEIDVMLSDPADPEPGVEPWPGPPGLYAVVALITVEDEQQASNAAPFTLAPRITDIDTARADDDVTVTVTFSPAVEQEQQVSLLLGARQVSIPSRVDAAPRNELDFTVKDVAPGDYFVRLRVDGVDSLLVVDRTAEPPAFDPDQKVEIE